MSTRKTTPRESHESSKPRSLRLGFTRGTPVAGQHLVEDVIGEGPIGIVVVVRDNENRLMAMKFLQPAMRQVPELVAQFGQGAHACSSLTSRHLARVYGVGASKDVGPFVLTELLDGVHLGRMLVREGRLPARRACAYVGQACVGLADAHRRGMLHGDLKPHNLFVVVEQGLETVKVTDFGTPVVAATGNVFLLEGWAPEAGDLVGTPIYLSPEQVRGKAAIDHRSDIWSLGLVLWELLTGKPAFVARRLMQACALVLESDPTKMLDALAHVHPDLQLIVARCLEKDPARRFQDVQSLRDALAPFTIHRAALAHRAPPKPHHSLELELLRAYLPMVTPAQREHRPQAPASHRRPRESYVQELRTPHDPEEPATAGQISGPLNITQRFG